MRSDDLSYFDPSIQPVDDGAAFLTSVFGPGLGERRLVPVGEGWEFESPVLIREVAGTDASWFGEDDIPLFTNIDAIGEPVQMTIRVDLPGKAIDGRHNATSVDGGEFTWVIDYDNPPERLFAATEPSSGLPAGVFIIGGVAVAALLGLGLVARRSSIKAGRPNASAVQRQPVVAEPVTPGEQFFDPANQVWVSHDPVQGKVWYHEASGKWVPF